MTREECNMGLGLDMASIGVSKQAEIREGVDELIDGCYSRELSACPQHTIFQRQKFLNELFPYLHSKSVVIKVDRELPDVNSELNPIARSDEQRRMLNVGYVAVEEI